MKTRVWSFFLLLLLLLVTPVLAGKEDKLENKRTFPRDFETVWNATLGVLQERAEPIVHSDKANGVITTDYKLEEKKKQHKFSLLIAKKTESETTVSVTCSLEKRSGSIFVGTRGNWEHMKSDGKREKELLDDIGRRVGTQAAK